MKTCSSPQELSNGVLHSICTHLDRVDSRLFVVGSQIAGLTSDLLSTITCVVDVQMAHARPFSTSKLQGLSNSIKNTSRRGVLTSAIEL
jgi:hypothetical protein